MQERGTKTRKREDREMKTKIKTFDERSEEELDRRVNKWLDENNVNVKDIKFSSDHYYNCGSCIVDERFFYLAMIIYTEE